MPFLIRLTLRTNGLQQFCVNPLLPRPVPLEFSFLRRLLNTKPFRRNEIKKRNEHDEWYREGMMKAKGEQKE